MVAAGAAAAGSGLLAGAAGGAAGQLPCRAALLSPLPAHPPPPPPRPAPPAGVDPGLLNFSVGVLAAMYVGCCAFAVAAEWLQHARLRRRE